jgi:hypothetical protein
MTRPKGAPPPAGRWCPEHGRHECTKAKHGGGPCHGTPARGLDACRRHLGKSERAAMAAALHAWAAVPGDDSVSPMDAAMGQLGLAFRRARLLGEEVARQIAGADGDGHGGMGGLVGFTYSASESAGGIYATGERIRGLVELEAQERDRVVRFAVACHQMGVADTRNRYIREAGDWLTSRLDDLLARLGVDVRDVGDVIAAWLRDQPAPGD